jgi:hypothetical protein
LIDLAAGVSNAIDAAVSFLARRQQPYGELAAYRYFNPSLEGAGMLDSSPFTTTFAMHALELVSHPAAGEIRRRAAAFLLEERSGPGLWRYWASRAHLPIDPDLDDTCCVSYALRDHPSGEENTRDNVERILGNRDRTGMFKTWLRGDGQPNDVDSVVNANVLLYLGERPETEAARDALVRIIREGHGAVASHYYLDELALHYAVGRAFGGGVLGLSACRGAVSHAIAARRARGGGTFGGAMTTALAVCALTSFEAFDDRALAGDVAFLLRCQGSDGGFPRAAFYAGPEPPEPHRVYWGSEELTTALCLEALARFGRAQATPASR